MSYGNNQNTTHINQNINRVYNPNTIPESDYPAPWPMPRTEYDKIMNSQSTVCECCKLNTNELKIPRPQKYFPTGCISNPILEGYYGTPPSKHYQYSTRSQVLALEDPDNCYSYGATNLYKY